MKSPSDATDFDGCFRFADPFKRRYGRVDLELPEAMDPWSLLDGSLTPSAAIPASWATAGDADDVMWTTEAVLGLVSERFVRWLEEEAVTGWRLFPIAFKNGRMDAISYHGLVVTGRSAPVEYWQRPGPLERKDWLIRLQPSTWDGSDFFLAEGTAYIFATEKVHRIVKNHQVKNIEIKRLSDVRIADVVVRNLSRARH